MARLYSRMPLILGTKSDTFQIGSGGPILSNLNGNLELDKPIKLPPSGGLKLGNMSFSEISNMFWGANHGMSFNAFHLYTYDSPAGYRLDFTYKGDDGVHIAIENTGGSSNGNLVLVPRGYYNYDYDHSGASPHPTFWFQSSTNPDTDNTQWGAVRRYDSVFTIAAPDKLRLAVSKDIAAWLNDTIDDANGILTALDITDGAPGVVLAPKAQDVTDTGGEPLYLIAGAGNGLGSDGTLYLGYDGTNTRAVNVRNATSNLGSENVSDLGGQTVASGTDSVDLADLNSKLSNIVSAHNALVDALANEGIITNV